jgi:hypothetical protein
LTKNVPIKKLVQARWLALFFATLGIVPLELIIPTIAVIWQQKLFIFSILSIYFLVYVVFLTNSLRVLWIADRKVLRNLHITKYKIGRIGSMFVSSIEWARMRAYQKRWHFSWKCLYFITLFVLGCLPFFVKFGIGLCVLRNNYFSYICLILGTTLRAYLLVYIGSDIISWVQDYLVSLLLESDLFFKLLSL